MRVRGHKENKGWECGTLEIVQLIAYCIPDRDVSNQAVKSSVVLKSNNASPRDSIDSRDRLLIRSIESASSFPNLRVNILIINDFSPSLRPISLPYVDRLI